MASLRVIDKIEREQLLKKCDRLCKQYQTDLIGLMIMSIDRQAEIKKANKLNNNKGE